MTSREPEAVKRLEEMLQRLEGIRAELEETDDPERAIETLRELSDLAKDVEGEIEQARRDAPDA